MPIGKPLNRRGSKTSSDVRIGVLNGIPSLQVNWGGRIYSTKLELTGSSGSNVHNSINARNIFGDNIFSRGELTVSSTIQAIPFSFSASQEEYGLKIQEDADDLSIGYVRPTAADNEYGCDILFKLFRGISIMTTLTLRGGHSTTYHPYVLVGNTSLPATICMKQATTTHSDTTIISGSGVHDTDVNFRRGNKHYLSLADDIEDLNLVFPEYSGNFLLLLHHNGAGRDITNYKVYKANATAATVTTVRWPGGDAPTLSSGSGDFDILSFYWDEAGEAAYGVATLDFETP